jgi:hypothetical protein
LTLIKRDSHIVAETSDAIPEHVLVVGPPQLTFNMVESVCTFYAWALDLSLPQQLKELIKENMIDAWTSSKPEDTQGSEEIMKKIQDIEKMEQDARDHLRDQIQEQFVKNLKTFKDEPVSGALLQLYEAENAPIAPGNPPLPKKIADTSIELINYQYHMLQNWRISIVKTEHKILWRQMLGSQWSNMAADWKNYYIAAPSMWAQLQSMSLQETAAHNQNFKANHMGSFNIHWLRLHSCSEYSL